MLNLIYDVCFLVTVIGYLLIETREQAKSSSKLHSVVYIEKTFFFRYIKKSSENSQS